MAGGVGGGGRHAGERERQDEKERPERAPLAWWSHGPKDAEISPGTIRASNRLGA